MPRLSSYGKCPNTECGAWKFSLKRFKCSECFQSCSNYTEPDSEGSDDFEEPVEHEQPPAPSVPKKKEIVDLVDSPEPPPDLEEVTIVLSDDSDLEKDKPVLAEKELIFQNSETSPNQPTFTGGRSLIEEKNQASKKMEKNVTIEERKRNSKEKCFEGAVLEEKIVGEEKKVLETNLVEENLPVTNLVENETPEREMGEEQKAVFEETTLENKESVPPMEILEGEKKEVKKTIKSRSEEIKEDQISENKLVNQEDAKDEEEDKLKPVALVVMKENTVENESTVVKKEDISTKEESVPNVEESVPNVEESLAIEQNTLAEKNNSQAENSLNVLATEENSLHKEKIVLQEDKTLTLENLLGEEIVSREENILREENISQNETIPTTMDEEKISPAGQEEEDKVEYKDKIAIDTELNFISTMEKTKSLEEADVNLSSEKKNVAEPQTLRKEEEVKESETIGREDAMETEEKKQQIEVSVTKDSVKKEMAKEEKKENFDENNHSDLVEEIKIKDENIETLFSLESNKEDLQTPKAILDDILGDSTTLLLAQTTEQQRDDDDETEDDDESKQQLLEKQKKESNYSNVYADGKRWKAELTHKGVRYRFGSSDDPKFLALKVNEKCKELEIDLKNPQLENEHEVYNNDEIKKDTESEVFIFDDGEQNNLPNLLNQKESTDSSSEILGKSNLKLTNLCKIEDHAPSSVSSLLIENYEKQIQKNEFLQTKKSKTPLQHAYSPLPNQQECALPATPIEDQQNRKKKKKRKLNSTTIKLPSVKRKKRKKEPVDEEFSPSSSIPSSPVASSNNNYYFNDAVEDSILNHHHMHHLHSGVDGYDQSEILNIEHSGRLIKERIHMSSDEEKQYRAAMRRPRKRKRKSRQDFIDEDYVDGEKLEKKMNPRKKKRGKKEEKQSKMTRKKRTKNTTSTKKQSKKENAKFDSLFPADKKMEKKTYKKRNRKSKGSPAVPKNKKSTTSKRKNAGKNNLSEPKRKKRKLTNKKKEMGINVVTRSLIINLDIGGTHYRTAYGTLKNCPFFLNLLAETEPDERNREQEFFVDRCGQLFRYILNYLRTKHIRVEELDAKTRSELIDEATFFQLDSLKDRLRDGLNLMPIDCFDHLNCRGESDRAVLPRQELVIGPQDSFRFNQEFFAIHDAYLDYTRTPISDRFISWKVKIESNHPSVYYDVCLGAAIYDEENSSYADVAAVVSSNSFSKNTKYFLGHNLKEETKIVHDAHKGWRHMDDDLPTCWEEVEEAEVDVNVLENIAPDYPTRLIHNPDPFLKFRHLKIPNFYTNTGCFQNCQSQSVDFLYDKTRKRLMIQLHSQDKMPFDYVELPIKMQGSFLRPFISLRKVTFPQRCSNDLKFKFCYSSKYNFESYMEKYAF